MKQRFAAHDLTGTPAFRPRPLRFAWPALLLFLALLLTACRPNATPPATDEVTVAAAASLGPALEALRPVFTQHTGITLTPIYGATGTLVQQAIQGAPYDVLLTADMKYLAQAQTAGALAAPPQPFARGELVLATPRTLPLQRLEDLTQPTVQRIALADPALAPYGAAAQALLERHGLWEALRPRLVYSANVRQAYQFLENGEVQAAFLAHSLLAPTPPPDWQVLSLPADYPPILHGAAILAQAPHPQAAQAFLQFLTSPEAQDILARYGFQRP